jgi:hypothetical protein
MEPNQVHLVAAAVFCDSQQIIHALDPRFTGQIVGDVADGNRRNRIDDDVALVHPVTTANLYVGTRPDANAASDPPAPDSLAKAFGEHHRDLYTQRFLDRRTGLADRLRVGGDAPLFTVFCQASVTASPSVSS